MTIRSDLEEPINIEYHELMTVSRLVDIVEEIVGVKLERRDEVRKVMALAGQPKHRPFLQAKEDAACVARLRRLGH
jgi:hypothetical protein